MVILTTSFVKAARRIDDKRVTKKVFKALDLFLKDPRIPGLNLENLTGNAAGLQSIRVDDNFRVILMPGEPAATLLFVGPHDEAYRFAERAERPSLAVAEPPSIYVPPPHVPAPLAVVEDLFVGGPKYLPLAQHLVSQPAATRALRLSFGQVEEILGDTLPVSARKYRPWWANSRSGHVQATAWLSVGWNVDTVDQSTEVVTFLRSGGQQK